MLLGKCNIRTCRCNLNEQELNMFMPLNIRFIFYKIQILNDFKKVYNFIIHNFI
jgi:hypothetical protein